MIFITPLSRFARDQDNALVLVPMNREDKSKINIPLMLSSLFVLIIICTFFIAMATRDDNNTPESKEDTHNNSVDFPIYYPSSYPSGYYLDKSSKGESDGVNIYTIRNDKGSALYISSQALPEKSVVQDFETNKMAFVEEVDCPIGHAIIGSIRGQTGASVTTNNTWVLITTVSDIETNVLKDIIASLKQD